MSDAGNPWLRLPGLRGGLLRWSGWLLAVALAACTPRPEPETPPHNGVAASLGRNALMDAVFGSGQQVVGKREVHWRAELMLPAPAAHMPLLGASAPPEAETPAELRRTPVLVTPREVVRLNDGQAALVLESRPAPTDGESTPPDAQTPGWLGAVFFLRVNPGAAPASQPQLAARQAEQWRIYRFMPFVAPGATQHLGAPQVYKLGSETYLLAFTPGNCSAQGCTSWLYGYLLQPQTMALALHLPLSANNRSSQPGCEARLKTAGAGKQQPPPAVSPVAPAAAPASQPGEMLPACMDVQGEISPISRKGANADVSVRFRGVIADADGPPRQLRQTLLYRLQNGQFTQIDGGDNPVPLP